MKAPRFSIHHWLISITLGSCIAGFNCTYNRRIQNRNVYYLHQRFRSWLTDKDAHQDQRNSCVHYDKLYSFQISRLMEESIKRKNALLLFYIGQKQRVKQVFFVQKQRKKEIKKERKKKKRKTKERKKDKKGKKGKKEKSWRRRTRYGGVKIGWKKIQHFLVLVKYISIALSYKRKKYTVQFFNN